MSTCNPLAAKTDTTWSVSFSVNMSKAVKDKIFHPESDFVYLVDRDGKLLPLKLVQGPGYRYTGTLYNEIDSTKNFNFRFRINSTVPESLNRTLTPQPGMQDISVWWNDDPLNITTFIVNMKYAGLFGLFNPATDSVSVIGTMNNWQGSPRMNRIGSSLDYSVNYPLDPGTIQQYKFRINRGDTALNHLELLFLPARTIRIPDTLATASSDFNNYNPGKRLVTFKCNMAYYIQTHRFSVAGDFLDVAGNFNNGGGNDVLSKSTTSSIYSIGLYIDTVYYHQGPLAFKFRINGKNGTTELDGKPDRVYTLHDTIYQYPNIYSCYYNNMDPSVPTPPWVYDVTIQGKAIHKNIIFGSYIYENLNGIREEGTTYRWLRSDDATGTAAVAIDSARYITHVVDTLDIGKWLVFEVHPKAAFGDSAVGKPVRVITATSVGGVGIGELNSLITRVYPNPAQESITIEANKEIDRVAITDLTGRIVLQVSGLHTQAIRLQTGRLPKGSYILKASAKSGVWGVMKLMKE